MKITAIETVLVNAVHRNWIFVKVVTDQPGLHGWGEATLEWKTRAVTATIEDLSPFVIGEDPMRIEHIVRRMTHFSFWPLGSIGLTVFAVDLYFATPAPAASGALSAAAFVARPDAWRVSAQRRRAGVRQSRRKHRADARRARQVPARRHHLRHRVVGDRIDRRPRWVAVVHRLSAGPAQQLRRTAAGRLHLERDNDCPLGDDHVVRRRRVLPSGSTGPPTRRGSTRWWPCGGSARR